MSTFPRSRTDAGDRASEDVVGLSAEHLRAGEVGDNLRHLLPVICIADGNCSTSKRVRYLNDLAKVIKHAGHIIEPNYPVERIIESARLSLLSGVKEVRAGALRVLRYLLTSWEAFSVMRKHCVDVLVTRSLDAPPNREIERLQAVRFVRQALTLSPSDFPHCLLTPLVSIVMYDAEQQDNLTWASVATLCELALHNPELAVQVGAINALLCGLLKCETFRITEAVILTLSHLLNCPTSRKYINSQFDIESLLAPITDLQYSPLINDNSRTGSTASRQITQRIEASKMALISLLKTWPGIFCLCNPHNLGLTSLLHMLPLAKPEVQREILDVLYGVFQLKVPEWTSSYYDAITSIDPTQPKTEWGLSEGFVVEEGRDLLPPKTVDRTNLIDCYQALLLAALVEEGLLEVLIETVRQSEHEIMVMASILLGQLLHLTNVILPSSYLNDAHCLPKLVGFALDFETLAGMERIRASEVISCLDRVHQLKKEEVQPSSQYLKLILSQSGYFSRKKTNKEEQKNTHTELDEAMLAGLIKDTDVLATKEYKQWEWRPLLALLEHPGIKVTQIQEDALFAKFIKRLYNFFKPSNHHFSVILYSDVNSRLYSAVGQKLVKFLCRAEEGGAGFLFDLVTDIVNELSQVTASKLTSDVFSHASVSHKLARDYFLFLGTASFYRPTVLEQCKAHGALLDICNYQNRSDLMKLMLSSLDFSHDLSSQVILSKILTCTEKEMRLYATRHLRVLLRAKMPFFNSWGLELLVAQLYDLEKEVAIEALDILDEACEEDSFLKALVLQQPQLLHLGEKGAALLTRFFSVRRGFTLMSQLGYLDVVLEKWNKSYNKLYVYIVEEKLAESLTTFQRTQDKEFIRRTNSSVTNPKAFVPVHLYGQLAQQDEGCQLLDKGNYMAPLASCVQDALDAPSGCDVLEVKAALWALGHIGSSLPGLELLLEEDVLVDLVELAETCEVLSVRGTAYYSLCLISKTVRGAELLHDLNWSSVCHTHTEKWPLAYHRQGAYPTSGGDPTFASPATTPSKGSHATTPLGRTQTPRPAQFGGTLPWMKASGNNSFSDRPGADRRRRDVSTSSEKAAPRTKHPSLKNFKDVNSVDIPSHASRFHSSYGRAGKKAQTMKKRPSDITISEHSVSAQPKHQTVRQRKVRPVSIADSGYSRSYSDASLRQSVSYTSSPYVGVCLPMDIPKMFKFSNPPYRGFTSQFTSTPEFNEDVLPHNKLRCLECSIPLVKAQHQGPGDEATSQDDPSFGGGAGLFKLGSSNSLSPEMRARSVTTESSPSGEGSAPDTPQSSLPSQGNSKSSTSTPEEDGLEDRGQRNVPSGGNRSPLIRYQKVVSDENDPTIQRAGVNAGEPHSGSKSTGSSSDIGSRIGNETNTVAGGEGDVQSNASAESGSPETGVVVEERGEEVKDRQDVQINVIEPSVSAKVREELPQVAGSREDSSSTGTDGSRGKNLVGGKSGSGHGPGLGRGKDTSETGSLSSLSQSSGSEGSNQLHLAYLEMVYSLSSDVALRKNTATLNMLCQKYPNLCQDVCLYSKVMDLLSNFQYKLNTRRFIQAKFDKLSFASIFATKPQLDDDFSEEDFLSSACSSRRGSFTSTDFSSADSSSNLQSSGSMSGTTATVKKHRRRSSTSDATKFREKLHSLSKSMERHENLVAESPNEREFEEERGDDQIDGEREEMGKEKETPVKERTNTTGRSSGGSGCDTTELAANGGSEGSREGSQGNELHRKMLNYPGKSRESTASSVYNVGFDL